MLSSLFRRAFRAPPLKMDTDKTPENVPPSAETEPTSEAPVAAPENLDKAQAEMETLRDRHLRLQADFENFRRRTQREKLESQTRAIENLVESLLPVLDHFDLGLQSAADHGATEAVLSGFRMMRAELFRALERAGLNAVDTQPGQPFDPNLHEAVTTAPSAEHPADTVLQQTRRGYRLGPQLLRPAQVVVSSGAPKENANGQE
ncbi:MAG: nucleotide exchange factor GrpE [Kiritimatiellae bacterium]|nr:nucleotide exchange factor GrpE [Kiritimatiellia bacterium]MCO6399974.1 nucleotide exchange factor GrpE [Verrucomicrobiota bacterium]